MSLLAIIRPISPEPKITTFFPTIVLVKFIYLWATPALYIPAGLVPGVEIAPLVLSLHPIVKITALALYCFKPCLVAAVTTLSLFISITVASVM